jgi:C-terminal processing protease CtpA/Prc
MNFSPAQSGTLAEHGYGGIVGSEILRRFTATFDYPEARMLLEPNAHFGEPFDFDMSGLYLAGDERIEVLRVVDDSPAAEAGIREGDRVLTDRPLEELRRALRSEPGVEHVLELERDGRRFAAAFRLRRLI